MRNWVGTLQADFDEIQRVRNKRRQQTRGQAGNGFNQNGGDPILGCTAHEGVAVGRLVLSCLLSLPLSLGHSVHVANVRVVR